MSGIERVLEIAASTRVLRERRLAALGSAPDAALLGREFLNLRALAEQCAAETGEVVRRVLDGAALARAVAACATRSKAFGPLVAERPGLGAALASTLRDLRDAGLAPSALPDEVAPLRALYSDLERALDALARSGMYDRVGLFRLAARGAGAWLARRGFTAVEVHGATELVGSAGDLVDALARALPAGAVRYLQPDWGDPHGDRLRSSWPWPRYEPEPVEVIDSPALTRDGPIPAGRLTVLHARTPRDELERVAQAVLHLLEAGVAPREILIVGRSLEPYAAWLAPVFDGYGIPVTSSLVLPEVSAPRARAWLDLVHVLARDLERAPLVRFLDASCERDLARAAERVARLGAVVRGDADWRAALETAERNGAGAELGPLRRKLARIVEARSAFASARSFRDASRVVLGLGADLAGDEARAALEAVALLDEVDREARAPAPPSAAELESALEAALLGLDASWHARDEGGVRVLDAIQARALPCAHLFLIGMVHGAWPREVREDPFLPDRLRETLRQTSRRPVPVRGWALAEERLLLGLLLSQARERVVLSYAQTDGAGRTLAPSGLLRELPFVERGIDVVPRDPTPESDAHAFAREAPPLFADAPAILEAGRALVAYSESTAPGDLAFDGGVGARALALPDALSPSFVDQLGRCPLQAFFERVLCAKPLDEPAPDALEATEAGTLVHETLKRLYQDLFDAGALRAGANADATLDRALALLPGTLTRASDALRSRVRTRHPAIWEAYVGVVETAIADFLRRDLAALLPAGVAEIETERTVAAGLDLGAPRKLQIAGRVDRIVRDFAGELRVGDYKTGRDFGKPVSKARVRRGTSLQIPLYAMAVAAERGAENVLGEALPVPLRPERDRDDEREKERSLALDQITECASPVAAELAGLLERGEFPFWEDENECRYCAYTVACRRTQDESHARLRVKPSLRAWLALRGSEA